MLSCPLRMCARSLVSYAHSVDTVHYMRIIRDDAASAMDRNVSVASSGFLAQTSLMCDNYDEGESRLDYNVKCTAKTS